MSETGRVDEEDEEEVTVLVTLENVDEFPTDCSDIQILELDSPTPYLQVGGKVFQCKYRDSVGTHLLMEKNEEDQYVCRITTEKELNCKKVVLLPKDEKDGGWNGGN